MNDPVTDLTTQVDKTVSDGVRIAHLYHCTACGQLIQNSGDGYVIHGNVYIADPSIRGGLIGNNFPINIAPGVKFELTDVKEVVFCRKCLLKALNIDFRTGEQFQRHKPKATNNNYVPRVPQRSEVRVNRNSPECPF